MNKEICKNCKNEINRGATICPHCKSDLRSWWRRHYIITAILIGFVFINVLVGIFSSTSNLNDTHNNVVDIKSEKESTAKSVARDYVKAFIPLKSPSTAKYGYYGDYKLETVATSTYNISYYIDAQNSFGAMIRSYWEMKLQYIGGNNDKDLNVYDNWIIKSLTFDGEKIK